MKLFKCLPFLLLTLCFHTATAQNEFYGENPTLCKEKLSILTTYYKQKAYTDAAPSLRYLLNNCPQASKNIYIIGNKVYETLIDKASTEEQKESYIDSLLLLQDWRIKYFPDNKQNQLRADKAIYLLKYRLKNEYPQAFSLLDSSFHEGAEELSTYDLYMYMYCYNIMVKSKRKTCPELISDYLKVNAILQKNAKSGEKTDSKTIEKINEFAEICMDCNLADSIYNSNFDANKTDTIWLDNGISLLSGKGCNSSNALLLLLSERFKTSQDIKTAVVLARYYLNTQDYALANSYLEKALTLTEDSASLSNIYLLKSNYFISNKNYKSAFLSAKKSSQFQTNNGKALIAQGDAIAYSIGSCSNMAFGGKELYWLATDYYNIAYRKADSEEEKAKAQKKIAQFSQYFPEKGELFLKSLKDGDSYKIDCFFNESTTVRSKQ